MILFFFSLAIVGFSTIVMMGTLFHYAYEKRDWNLLGLLAGYHVLLLFGAIYYSLISSVA